MLRTLLAWIRTLALVPLFLGLTVLVALFITVYGTFRPGDPIHGRMLRFWSGMWLRIPPVRVNVAGLDRIDPDQRYVIIANHLSMFDIPLLLKALPLEGRFLAKQEVFKIPLVAQAMRTVGIIEINRERGGSSREAINRGVKLAAERGYSLVIFPEGTRSTEGHLLPFKKGAFRIAIDTGLPVLPVVIDGTDRVSQPGRKVFFPGQASLRILDPIETSGMTNRDDLTPLFARVEAQMNAAYDEMHQPTDD